MVKRHLSRLTAPKSWPIRRKGIKWIAKPSSGPYALKNCISINLLLTKILKYTKILKEVKSILNEGKVLVNKSAVNDPKFPVGVMDVIEIPSTKEAFRVLYTEKGKFTAVKIKDIEAKIKPCKIKNKTMLKGKKLQINFMNGWNMLVDKDEYKTNDTIFIDLEKLNNPKEKKAPISKHLKFEKGAIVYITEGRHKGFVGTIEEISKETNTIDIKSGKETFKTSLKFGFVVDKTLSLGESK